MVSDAGAGTGGRLADTLGYELKRVQHALRREMDEELRGLGVTTPQYAAMSVLAEEPGLSNAQLARRSFVTPQTMNQILVKLEAAGLVERRAHAEHGRVLQSFLTESGGELLRACRERVLAVEARMGSALSDEEGMQVIRALRLCAEALGRSPRS